VQAHDAGLHYVREVRQGAGHAASEVQANAGLLAGSGGQRGGDDIVDVGIR
jgi:hypothetical protein